MQNTHSVKIAIALSAGMAVFILHGFSFLTAAVLMYAGGAVFIRCRLAAEAAVILTGGFAVLSIAESTGPVILATGAVLALACSRSAVSRYFFLLCAAAVAISGAIEGMIPLIIALAAAAFMKDAMLRCIILAAGLSAVLLISGLPRSHEYPFSEPRVILAGDTVLWQEPLELNLGSPEMILKYPHMNVTEVTLHVSAGGVRDSDPVGYAYSGSSIIPISSGEHAILFQQPEFPVYVRISREWKPFTHPVIHFRSAEAAL